MYCPTLIELRVETKYVLKSTWAKGGECSLIQQFRTAGEESTLGTGSIQCTGRGGGAKDMPTNSLCRHQTFHGRSSVPRCHQGCQSLGGEG